MKIKGLITALATPFENGKLDLQSFTRLVEQQLKDGVEGFVIGGTTGESPTLHADEIATLFKKAREIAGKNTPLIIGTGSNSTEESIKKTKAAQELGADAALVVVPYYNKPPQRGLVKHFNAIAKSSRIPLILYNVPTRTITNLDSESCRELFADDKIIGIKDATGDMDYLNALMKHSPNKTYLSGDDFTLGPFMKVGGHGVISVVSHVMAAPMIKLLKNPHEHTEAFEKQYMELMKHLFVEANPIPVKMALYLKGIIKSPELRLPLDVLADNHTEKLKQLLAAI